MSRVEDFDAFYHADREALLHQTYVLTGNVETSAHAVEHAFAHGWSHWRKVRHLQDPLAWVRTEAWRKATSPMPRRSRRGTVRRWRRSSDAEAVHAQDMLALLALPDGQRRAVVLHHLAALPVDRIAREIGISERSASSLLSKGEQAWEDPGTSIDTALTNVGHDVADVRLNRAPSVRRAGDRRRRQHTLAGLVTAAALLTGGGALIMTDSPTGPVAPTSASRAEPAAPSTDESDPAATPDPFLLDRSALLNADEMTRLTRPKHRWNVASTSDGTTGNPIYAPCQRAPFADPEGKQSLLRRYESRGGDLSSVEVIEESRSEAQGRRAFGTMEDWYARCADDGIQLLSTKSVRGLGDRARAFMLRKTGPSDTLLTVGIVRTGPITTAVIGSSEGAPVPAQRVLTRAAVSVRRMCLPVSGDCSAKPRAKDQSPLPTHEHPGFLAGYDLPPISNVSAPWVGTDPVPSPENPGATPCERANFGRPQQPRTRVFLVPTATKLPKRFGLAETIGTFDSRPNAQQFVQRAYTSVEGCTDRELSAEQPHTTGLPGDHAGRIWRFEFEVNKSASVFYRVGLVRSGRHVALVSMSPSDVFDVTQAEFSRLVARASERLSEAAAAEGG